MKNLKNKIKNKKGITLVALVVTIIILLILAGIAISQLTDSGLFGKAKIAKEKAKNSQDLENSVLGDYENQIDSYVDGDRGTVTLTQDEYNEFKRKGYTLLWEGVANKTGSADNSGNNYNFKQASMDVDNYDFILLEFKQNENPLKCLESNMFSTSSINKNVAHDIRFTSYSTRYTTLHFVNNGFVIDGINAETTTGYQYLTKIYGINI